MISRRRRGDALAFKSDDWNQIADYINAQASPGVNAPTGRSVMAEGVVLIKNNTGGDLARFQPVMLASPVTDPTANEPEFFRSAAFFADQVAYNDLQPGRFALLLESVSDGNYARAAIVGTHGIIIQVNDETHMFARCVESSSTLESVPSGAIPIIWKEAGTGLKRAIVSVMPSVLTTVLAVITGSTTAGPRRWSYAWSEGELDGTRVVPAADGRSSAFDGSAFNINETANASVGIQGNGIDHINLNGTFDLVPIGVGAAVEISGPYFDDATPFWKFSAVNAVDGIC
jgi:hypothetical protein